MATKNRFGAFAGVFTPSILTILGVIMYMRMGWVVGNAGLIGTLIIIVISHVISLSTGLSISSIATDKKVGAGGIYYILSRSMGIPIGGAIGITLYVGTAFSIALYLIGFAESFNEYLGLDIGINGLRISGSIALLLLTIIALISTSAALKTQFFILAAIIISLVSIFFGTHDFTPETVQMFSSGNSVPMETIFAIYFPAVTGFTAGIAMSGDLKDPKKSIPRGTMAAIAVGFVVYIVLAIFISYYIDSETLKQDNNILLKMALFAPAVIAGIWGATLSSALGGILGGPRILQAMSVDRVTPKIFGKGRGKSNEPINALIFVFVIAQLGILIGELDVIARVVSMFYLAAYGFINLSFFLERWANPDFQPSFKVSPWFGLVGFIACFGVMFKLDMIAMLGSIVVIMGIYLWLQRKRITLESGDVWQSVWGNIVTKGLKKIETTDKVISKWNPNIILFSGNTERRPYLLLFSKMAAGRTGIVTNFNLISKEDNSQSPQQKSDQIIKDDTLEKLGIFGRRIEVDNIYTGVENIATTFGFTGIDPNTVMMGWPKTSKDPIAYSKMTEKLIQLDYNLLYLDYDQKSKFGTYSSIDLWWRETDNNNAEMMLYLSRFIKQSPQWNKAKIRVLFVNHNNVDNSLIKSKISQLITKLRIDATIKIINNGVEQLSFYKIIAIQSATTNLTILGIPNISIEKQADYILKNNHLFKMIGTTLLVKASKRFNKIELNFEEEISTTVKKSTSQITIPVSENAIINELITDLDSHLSLTSNNLIQPSLNNLSRYYNQLIEKIESLFNNMIENMVNQEDSKTITIEIQHFFDAIINLSVDFRNEKLTTIQDLFTKAIAQFVDDRSEYIKNMPKKVLLTVDNSSNETKKIYWKEIVKNYSDTNIASNIQTSFYSFGVQNYNIVQKISSFITKEAKTFLAYSNKNNTTETESLALFKTNIIKFLSNLKSDCLELKYSISKDLDNYEREVCLSIFRNIENPNYTRPTSKPNRRETSGYQSNINSYASDWYRNQTLVHQQTEAELKLSSAGLALIKINHQIGLYIKENLVLKQQKQINVLSSTLHDIKNQSKKQNHIEINTSEIDSLTESVSNIKVQNILEYEEEKILLISEPSSNMPELMSANSSNLLYECQNDDIESISINLSKIQEHIIQSSYLIPVQAAKHNLTKKYNENAEEIYNLVNLIKHILDESKSDKNISLNEDLTNDIQDRIGICATHLNEMVSSFYNENKMNLDSTISDLSIRTILESENILSIASQTPMLKTKFQDWYNRQKSGAYNLYESVAKLILQHKQDIDTLAFDKKNDRYLNIIEQTANFMESLSIDVRAEKHIPFYYKKLFSGSHLSAANSSIRAKELKAAQIAIERIENGVSGAIMVLGESMSGKSYFSAMIAKSLIGGDRYEIKPPIKQKYNPTDLDAAFRRSFNKKGSVDLILSKLKPKSVIIFNDLEKWWLQSKNGQEVIDYLSKMIEIYGSKHYFIINCNIHSFQNIRYASKIEKQLLTTIVLAPLNKSALKNIILNRHKTAGTAIYFQGKLINGNKKQDLIFADIHTHSEGNIGIALYLWINNIRIDNEEDLYIIRSKALNFPTIKNPNWKLVIYHLLISGQLRENQIQNIFQLEDIDWILDTCKEMEKAGLVYKMHNSTYHLKNIAKPFIEKRMKALKILI